MRALAGFLLMMFTGVLAAQTVVNKTYPVTAGQKVSMQFDYPEVVKITTWDKNEISITGMVTINGGESDDAFELKQSVTGNTIYIENEIHNMKSLPQRITVMDGAQKITFKTKDEYKKYCSEHGREFKTTSWGLDMEIVLEVKVPKGMETQVESVYGIVEVKNFAAPLSVLATYGGVDASVVEKTVGELSAQTDFGQIYTNLDVKLTGSEKDFHTEVSARPGVGPHYSFESKYGNVYLRKAI